MRKDGYGGSKNMEKENKYPYTFALASLHEKQNSNIKAPHYDTWHHHKKKKGKQVRIIAHPRSTNTP